MDSGVVVLALLIFAIGGVVRSVKKTAKRPGAAEPGAPAKEKPAAEPKPARRAEPAEKIPDAPAAAPAKARTQPVSRGQLTAKDMRRAFVMSEILRKPVSMREDRQ